MPTGKNKAMKAMKKALLVFAWLFVLVCKPVFFKQNRLANVFVESRHWRNTSETRCQLAKQLAKANIQLEKAA